MGWHALTQVKIGGTTYNLPYCHDGWADVLGADGVSGNRYDNTDSFSGTFPFYCNNLSEGTETLNIGTNSTFVFYYTKPTNVVLTYNKNNATKQYAGWYNGNATEVAYGIIVDDDNHLARLFMFEKGSGFQYIKSGAYADLQALEDLYTDVQGIMPVQYNWQSVPSIVGKNGISLSLSTLNDINNGDPVITTDTSKFSISDENNLYTLITNNLS